MSKKSPDPVFRLARLASLVRIQIVDSQSSVRVENEEWLILAPKVLKDLHQYSMLENLRSIPGVVGVTVVHYRVP